MFVCIQVTQAILHWKIMYVHPIVVLPSCCCTTQSTELRYQRPKDNFQKRQLLLLNFKLGQRFPCRKVLVYQLGHHFVLHEMQIVLALVEFPMVQAFEFPLYYLIYFLKIIRILNINWFISETYIHIECMLCKCNIIINIQFKIKFIYISNKISLR